MMPTRFLYLIIGCIIGFFLGYLSKTLKDLGRRIDTVDKHVLDIAHPDHDEGFANSDWINRVALFFVVLLVMFAAISSQQSSDKVKKQSATITQEQSDLRTAQNKLSDQQKQISRIGSCNEKFLKETIAALNARTQHTQEQNAANVKLQKSQLQLLKVFQTKPPSTTKQRNDAFSNYVIALTEFVNVSGKTSSSVANNPYPTNKELPLCLAGKEPK